MRSRQKIRRAVLLVAGKGERLRPLTETQPKCLVEVLGESLIVRMLRQLKSSGVEEVVLVTGYRGDDLKDAVTEDVSFPKIVYVENETFESYNNCESVAVGLKYLNTEGVVGEDEAVLVADGDVLLRDGSIFEMLESSPSNDVFAVDVRDDLGEEEMKVIVDGEGRVIALDKGLDPAKSLGESIGFQTLSREAIDRYLKLMEDLSEEAHQSYYYETVIAQDEKLLQRFSIVSIDRDSFIEIDTVEDLEAARALASRWSKDHATV